MLGDVTDPPVNVHICTRVWIGKSPLIQIKYLRFFVVNGRAECSINHFRFNLQPSSNGYG